MAILMWTLALPVVATLLAIAWMQWSLRPRKPAEPMDSTADYQRFREALSAPNPRVPTRSAEPVRQR